MKTREERAREYVSQLAPGWVGKAAGDQLEAIHIAGAESEHAELTRYNDPQEVLPDNDARVLCRIAGIEWTDKMLLEWYGGRWWYFDATPEDDCEPGWREFTYTVLGWREIHE